MEYKISRENSVYALHFDSKRNSYSNSVAMLNYNKACNRTFISSFVFSLMEMRVNVHTAGFDW